MTLDLAPVDPAGFASSLSLERGYSPSPSCWVSPCRVSRSVKPRPCSRAPGTRNIRLSRNTQLRSGTRVERSGMGRVCTWARTTPSRERYETHARAGGCSELQPQPQDQRPRARATPVCGSGPGPIPVALETWSERRRVRCT